MGIFRAVRLLMRIAASPDLERAFLSSPESMQREKLEAAAREFLASLPILPGVEEDTWNHEKRIRTAFGAARVWLEELAK